ncbi:MAG: hypothetical protein A3D50_00080 [Candidatus Taylorbacteria bacterium RIFCSPHIGHO2_02_FULL_44_12]|uniref:Type 4a pilus biogenesis protein PilO n=1 Tax=Candidatus Taylorbacteria bacterium RIFCSPHIGHO2_02_FULL_44_12 TaxID=1802308 RepID=A0A1G2MMZ0_9BACT|nr:MAG: hypothetical protein A3D50_00080 [Candidatus Taylorbacteria bacterium RIFCSPHIGHO2_02_FULL_44_12]
MNRNAMAIILIILALGVYFTFTKSLLTETSAIRATNKQYTAAIANAEQLIKVRDNILKQWRNISSEDQERLDKMIPNTVDNIRLIIDLNSVALRHGFSLRNIKATAAQSVSRPTQSLPTAATAAAETGAVAVTTIIATPTLDTVSVSFGVTAPYLQFLSFLQDLEADLRIMDITHLSVTANDTGVYDFGVGIKTYWLRQ